MDEQRLPDLDAIAAILQWAPILRRPAGDLYGWQPSRVRDDGVLMMPYVEYSPEILGFERALSEHGFVVPFDWPTWADEGMAIQKDSTRLSEADLRTVVKLFTLHVRADRFSEGHLAEAIDQGWLLALLERLRVLQEGAPPAAP